MCPTLEYDVGLGFTHERRACPKATAILCQRGVWRHDRFFLFNRQARLLLDSEFGLLVYSPAPLLPSTWIPVTSQSTFDKGVPPIRRSRLRMGKQFCTSWDECYTHWHERPTNWRVLSIQNMSCPKAPDCFWALQMGCF